MFLVLLSSLTLLAEQEPNLQMFFPRDIDTNRLLLSTRLLKQTIIPTPGFHLNFSCQSSANTLIYSQRYKLEVQKCQPAQLVFQQW